MGQDRFELVRPCRQVVEAVAAGPALLVELLKPFAQAAVTLRVGKLAPVIKNGVFKVFPELIVDGLTGELSRRLLELGSEALVRFLAPRKADGRQPGRQIAVCRQ